VAVDVLVGYLKNEMTMWPQVFKPEANQHPFTFGFLPSELYENDAEHGSGRQL